MQEKHTGCSAPIGRIKNGHRTVAPTTIPYSHEDDSARAAYVRAKAQAFGLMRRVQTLEDDIRFTKYRLDVLPADSPLRAALAARLEILWHEYLQLTGKEVVFSD